MISTEKKCFLQQKTIKADIKKQLNNVRQQIIQSITLGDIGIGNRLIYDYELLLKSYDKIAH